MTKLARDSRQGFCNNCFSSAINYRSQLHQAKRSGAFFGQMFAVPEIDINSLFTDSDLMSFAIAKPVAITRGRDVDSIVLMSGPDGSFKTKAKKQVFYLEFACDKCKVGHNAIECGLDEAQSIAKKHGLQVEDGQ